MASATSAPRRGVRSIWPWLLLGLAVALWAFWGAGGSGLPEGEVAPSLSVPWTGGERFDLSERRGHVTVLAFWATWFPACRSEGPVLARVQRRIEARGDTVVGVSIDDAPLSAVAQAARRFGMTYPIALATRADIAPFRVELLPTIVVVDPDGRVAASFAGTVSEHRLVAAIESAR